jgi:hypothetical protein
MILAAEYAWNGGDRSPKDLSYRPEEMFQTLWNRENNKTPDQAGFTINLSELYNSNFGGKTYTDWAEWRSDDLLRILPASATRLKGDLYQFAPTSQNQVIRLDSRQDQQRSYPQQVTIPIQRKASTLLFLQNTAWPDDTNREVGQTIIHYADGSQETINLVYGINIAAWNDPRILSGADVAWMGGTKEGQKAVIRRLTWTNPSPEKEIQSIEIKSTKTEAGIALLAISGLD